MEELRNLRSSSEVLLIDALVRFRRSLRRLIRLAIKNYCSFYYQIQFNYNLSQKNNVK